MKIKKLVKKLIKNLDSEEWSRKKKHKLFTKTLNKLNAYEQTLEQELKTTSDQDDIARLQRRIKLTQDQKAKARKKCKELLQEGMT